MQIDYRVARLEDVPALETLIPVSARELQSPHYSPAQLDGAIGTVFGVDTQLIKDGTYFVAVVADRIVACGGWSRRQTLYGGDRAKTAPDPLRDPARDPAMIRAFFVHPNFARKGIGRELMRRSEQAALAAGFRSIEIIATLAGEPLYASCGYVTVERYSINLVNGLTLPVVRMKSQSSSAQPTNPICRLTVECWTGQQHHVIEQESPNPADLQRLFARLNGRSEDTLSLETGAHGSLLIGGGPDRFIAVCFEPDGSSFHAEQPGAVGKAESLQVGGQVGDYPRRFILDRDLALKIATRYFDSRSRLESLAWVRDTGPDPKQNL